MCTASIIRYGPDSALRLAFSRDELLTRAVAKPPELLQFGQRQAVMPIDPDSGGTWIGVNDAGLAFAILNRNVGDQRSRDESSRSRGLIIPSLLNCGGIREAITAAEEIDISRFAAFRLLIVDRQALVEVTSDRHRLRCLRYIFGREPLMFTSSGLGDSSVMGPRRQVFWALLRNGQPTCEQQDAFHRHRWSSLPHLSVCMNRPDARTVSYTVVELSVNAASMSYHAGAPDIPSAAMRRSIQRTQRQAA